MNSSTIFDYLRKSDPVLAALINQFEPYPLNRPQRREDLFTALAKAILYQSVSVKAANTVYARLLKLYSAQDSTQEVEPQFPTASLLLNTPDSVLQGVGVPPFKIRYAKALAHATLNGLPTLEQLETWDDEAIIQILTAVKGIGRWSVQMLLMFHLKRLDILPVTDLGIRAAIWTLYGLPQLPDKGTVEALGAKWRPYRTIAAWYLWQSRNQETRALLKAWS